jgi:Cu2+-containing amine oxidase
MYYMFNQEFVKCIVVKIEILHNYAIYISWHFRGDGVLSTNTSATNLQPIYARRAGPLDK